MAKILLVEPRRPLQQAISLSLSRGHDVETRDSITAAELAQLKDWNLLILDASGLIENDQLSRELVRAIQVYPTPILWLEDEDLAQRPKRDKFLALRIPLEKNSLESAVDDLLDDKTPEKKPALPEEPGPEARVSKSGLKKVQGETPDQESFNFIELVDVVNEPPASVRGRKSRRQSK
jgi:hypothetical protein